MNNAEQRQPNWEEITEAGGIDAWIRDELRRQALLDEGTDTSSLSDKERKQYKARREEERRVRKVLKKQAWAAYHKAHLVHVGVGVFHHDTADIDRFDIDDPAGRRKENEVPELKDVAALAKALNLPVPRLRWLVYHREVDTGTHYHRWTVPKRSGGQRLISAPKPDLKAAQKWIAANISEHLPVHGAAHGFVPGRSTVTNARAHTGAEVIVTFDLEDFYPTVTFPRVKGLFRKAGYGEQVATVLGLLCTESPREAMVIEGKTYHVAVGPRSLPQGAPTSPSITNAICLRLDSRMTGLARTFGFRYSRYADDLTFSWRRGEKAGPGEDGSGTAAGNDEGASQAAGRDEGSGSRPGRQDAPIGPLMAGVEQIIEAEGFRLNRKKTRVSRLGRRQKVTGLVVNAPSSGGSATRVPREIVRRLRAALHNRDEGRVTGEETLEQLQGTAAYIYMADRARGRQLLEAVKRLVDASGE